MRTPASACNTFLQWSSSRVLSPLERAFACSESVFVFGDIRTAQAETQTCQTIQDGIEQELAARGDSALSRQQAWDAQYKHTTRLASQTIARVTAQYLGEP